MKVLRIGILTLAVLFLIVGTCYAQSAEEYYTKGIDYGVAGKFEEAQQEFKKALETDPFYTPARMCLKLSEDTLKQRIKTGTALHLFKGVAYYDKDMYDEAIAEYKKAIKINPNYAEAHCVLGLVYAYKGGMFDEAIAEYKKAIEINPNYAEAHYNLGAVYRRKGMFDEAIAEYKKAIEINPNLAEAHDSLGLAYFRKGMYNEAIAEYKKAIEIDPEFAKTHYYLALAYYYKKMYKLAIEQCDKAIELGYKAGPKFLEDLKPYR